MELLSLSRGRCIDRWIATGLTRNESIELADDASVGSPGSRTAVLGTTPMTIVSGDFGIGKSLLCERHLQAAIAKARSSRRAPLPAYLEAGAVSSDLAEDISRQTRELGEPRRRGAFVLIDGGDQVEAAKLREIVRQARILGEAWPHTTIVLTTRSVPLVAAPEEVVEVPPLSDDDSLALIARVASRAVTPGLAAGWPRPIRDAIERPLFAILVGLHLRSEVGEPASAADLIAGVVRRALASTGTPISERSLADFAVMWLDRGGSVRTDEIDPDSAEELKRTALVVEREERLDFPLPILGQWFGAQALLTDPRAVPSLLRDAAQRERWRYALVILVGSGPAAVASHVLEYVAARDPGLAAELLDQAVARWPTDDEPPLPPVDEAAMEIRRAMRFWSEGVGDLATRIAPITSTGELKTLGIAAGVNFLETSWRSADQAEPAFTILRANEIFDDRLTWGSIRWGTVGGKPGWAWAWTLDELIRSLERELDSRVFVAAALEPERSWSLASTIVGRSGLAPIPLGELVDLLDSIPQDAHGVPQDEQQLLRELQTEAAALMSREIHVKEPPWPGPDVSPTTNYVWSGFSPEQLLRRTESVYQAALNAYQQIVDDWFDSFAPRLQTRIVLPATVTGVLSPPEGENPPVLAWYLEPRLTGEANAVSLRLASRAEATLDDATKDLYGRTRALRPEASDSLVVTHHYEVLEVFGRSPARELTYKWLWRDLRAVGWVRQLFRAR